MNAGAVKKLKKLAKVNWWEYVAMIKSWPFMERWRYCWYIMFDRSKPYRS